MWEVHSTHRDCHWGCTQAVVHPLCSRSRLCVWRVRGRQNSWGWAWRPGIRNTVGARLCRIFQVILRVFLLSWDRQKICPEECHSVTNWFISIPLLGVGIRETIWVTGIVNPERGEHGLEHWWGVIVGFRVFWIYRCWGFLTDWVLVSLHWGWSVNPKRRILGWQHEPEKGEWWC